MLHIFGPVPHLNYAWKITMLSTWNAAFHVPHEESNKFLFYLNAHHPPNVLFRPVQMGVEPRRQADVDRSVKNILRVSGICSLGFLEKRLGWELFSTVFLRDGVRGASVFNQSVDCHTWHKLGRLYRFSIYGRRFPCSSLPFLSALDRLLIRTRV